jgi:hypothetical protein
MTRFRDNRLTIETVTSHILDMPEDIDVDSTATPRVVAPKSPFVRLRQQPNRSSRRQNMRGYGQQRRRGVALVEKPWQIKQVYSVDEDTGKVKASI